MNNILTGPGIAVEDYNQGFTAEEYKWLQQDLALVPKDKCVVLCVHVSFFDGGSVNHNKYYTETLNLLKAYANAYIFSGHKHYARQWFFGNYNHVREVNHSSACGQFWQLKVCSDGSPAGYYVYTFEGNDISDQIFKKAGTATSSDGANAIRMYLGDDSHDTFMESGYGKNNTVVYFQLPKSGSYEPKFDYVNGHILSPNSGFGGMFGMKMIGVYAITFAALMGAAYLFYTKRNRRRARHIMK
jgi:hypothetical protein